MVVATVLVKPPPNAPIRKQETFKELFQKQKKLVFENKQFQTMLAVGTITTFGYLVSLYFCYFDHEAY